MTHSRPVRGPCPKLSVSRRGNHRQRPRCGHRRRRRRRRNRRRLCRRRRRRRGCNRCRRHFCHQNQSCAIVDASEIKVEVDVVVVVVADVVA